MYRLFEFAKKFEYQKLRTFNEKLCTLDIWIVWICWKFGFCGYIEYTKLCKLKGKLCILDVLIVWICKKFKYPKLYEFNENLCTLDVWIIWICKKFEFWRYVECTKLRKLNEKVCTELRKELAIMKGGIPFRWVPLCSIFLIR